MLVAAEEERTRGEVSDRRRRRRSWSTEERRRIVAETFEPGASVSIVARRHDVNANQVYSWRRRFGAEPQAFVPVVISPAPTPEPGVASGEAGSAPPEGQPAPSAAITGRMEIVLGCGSRIIVDKTVNATALARVIAALREASRSGEVLGRRPVRRSPVGEGG